MRSLFLLLLGSLLLLPLCSMAQQRAIRGRITDAAEKTPLPGVNITAKGTSVGVVSDAQGSFLLNLPAGANTLIVSSVGFNSQEITVGTRAEIDVVLVADTVPEAAAYAITRTFIRNKGQRLSTIHASMGAYDPATSWRYAGCPLHPGAMRAYREAGAMPAA